MLNLAYEEFGSENATPLLILHGFFASSRNWRQIAEKLAEQFHVYVLDLRNHGASPHHPVMDYPSMADDLLLFMDAHDLPNANLLGHSMGGKVAMWFALHYPERVAKLIVVDIAPVSYMHSFNNLINALQVLPLAELTNRKQAELWLSDAIPEFSYRQFLLQNLLMKNGEFVWRIDLDIFYRNADAIIAFPDTDALTPFTGIALFLGGADSTYVKASALIPLFPTAQLSFIADAGHWLHVQQPRVLVEQVTNFLSSEPIH